MMIWRNVVVLAVLATACTPATAACVARPPADLGAGPVTWLGACPGGRADGPGVLRAARAGGVLLFYGRMAAGKPETGVMTTAAGDYIPAWRFDAAGKPIDDPSGSRQSSVATFDAAAAGARAAGSRFAAAGNTGSARFYARAAKELETQLD